MGKEMVREGRIVCGSVDGMEWEPYAQSAHACPSHVHARALTFLVDTGGAEVPATPPRDQRETPHAPQLQERFLSCWSLFGRSSQLYIDICLVLHRRYEVPLESFTACRPLNHRNDLERPCQPPRKGFHQVYSVLPPGSTCKQSSSRQRPPPPTKARKVASLGHRTSYLLTMCNYCILVVAPVTMLGSDARST